MSDPMENPAIAAILRERDVFVRQITNSEQQMALFRQQALGFKQRRANAEAKISEIDDILAKLGVNLKELSA